MQSQHPEDLSEHVATNARVCSPSLAGHSYLPFWQHSASLKKRALYIIYPEAESRAHTVQLGELNSLDNRRDDLCNR